MDFSAKSRKSLVFYRSGGLGGQQVLGVLRRRAREAMKRKCGNGRSDRPVRRQDSRQSEARSNEDDSEWGREQVRAALRRAEQEGSFRARLVVASPVLNQFSDGLVRDRCAGIVGKLDLEAPREDRRAEKKHNQTECGRNQTSCAQRWHGLSGRNLSIRLDAGFGRKVEPHRP